MTPARRDKVSSLPTHPRANSNVDTRRHRVMLEENVMSAAPTFSVIVVCKNPGIRLHTALESVWGQSETSRELIVVDGSSSDGSREWLRSRAADIATLISEPDNGVYDAMNKGIKAARGEWLLFLGADDRLAHPDVLRDTTTRLPTSAAGVLGGEATFADGRSYPMREPFRPLRRNFLHHQAAYYHRSLFHEYGAFDASLSVMGDYDLNLRLWRQHVAFLAVPIRIAVCGTGGLSDRGSWRGYREEIQVRHRHFPPAQCFLWDLGAVLRFIRKQMVRRFSSRHG
jgi:putative colanic acid biosynthesis glycosyltransferase